MFLLVAYSISWFLVSSGVSVRFLHNFAVVSVMDEKHQKTVALTAQPLQKSDGHPIIRSGLDPGKCGR